jgi:hypothetical protein
MSQMPIPKTERVCCPIGRSRFYRSEHSGVTEDHEGRATTAANSLRMPAHPWGAPLESGSSA